MPNLWSFEIPTHMAVATGVRARGAAMRGVKAWKQVDLCHAESVAGGSVLIGRLKDFATIENGRADRSDGSLILDSGFLSSDVPEHSAVMERLGTRRMAGHVTMTDCIIETAPYPTYAFCMSRPGCRHDPSPSTPKAIFEISDIYRFAIALARAAPSRFETGAIGVVDYDLRPIKALDWKNEAPDPFRKRPEFAVEQEVRIAFTARQGSPYETLKLPPNRELAAMLKRIS